MNYKKTMISSAICILGAITTSTNANTASCGETAQPLLSVSDFNGDGIVNRSDLKMMAFIISEKKYFALYDRNADGKLGKHDLRMAKDDLGLASTITDQQMAKMYQRFSHIQNISSHENIVAMNYVPLGGPLAFHGQHWMNSAGQLAIGGLRTADPFIAEGLNVSSDGSSVPALFWGEHAVPLFNDPSAPSGLSTLDWPSPTGLWNFERVQAFADTPPDFFPDTEGDSWHKHAGTCITVDDLGNGPEFLINQHMSNAECQALPNLEKFEFNGQLINLWGNFWMLHAWLFDLNPNGTFANTHPCIDPDAPSEDDINGGREVPPFFQHHG